MKKIETLTPEQESELPRFRDKWLQIGLSTERVDKERATTAVKALYAAAGEQEPVVMHFDSPAQCIMAINFFRHFKIGAEGSGNLGTSLCANLKANLRQSLWASLGENLGDNLGENLRTNLRASLRAGLWASLGENLWANLRENLWANLRASLRENLGDNLKFVDTWFWGGQDAPWCAFYEFGRNIGVRYEKEAHFDAYIQYARSCGWMYAYEGIAFISDRPCFIRKDNQTRLHNETGPAVEFTDGYALYSWHGTTIPREWIENKSSLSAGAALTWENIEQRRAALEIVGWHNVLRELKAEVVDEHPDPLCGALVEVELPDLDRKSRFIHARCGTNREFAIGVPPEMKTVVEAQAWLTGLPVSDFEFPTVRT